MFGLCLPTGEIHLEYTNGIWDCIMIIDLKNPRKFIMNDKDILCYVKLKGYMNIKSIIYIRDNKKTVVRMADYFAEHGQELV